MDPAQNRPPFPPSERVDAGPAAEIRLTRERPPLFVDSAFSRLELLLGDIGGMPPIEIESGLEWPQAHARYVVVQDVVLREDPRRGWAPVGGVHRDDLLLGPAEAGQFSFAVGVGGGDGLLIRAYDTFLSITGCGEAVGTVRVGVADLLTAAEASARIQEGAPLGS